MPDDFDPFKQGAIAVDPDTFDPFKQGAIAVDPAPSTSPLSEKAVTDTQDWMRTMVLQNPRGLIEPGNIDLYHRPIVQNADGSLDAVRPQSVGIDGREVLLPSVAGDGRNLTVPEMVDTFRRTNQHLGIFDNPANATSYAEILHQQQNQLYGPHGLMQPKKEPAPAPAPQAAPSRPPGYVGRGEFAPEAGIGPFGLTKEDLAKMHPSERAFTETTGQVTEAIAKNVVGMFPTSIAAAGEMATPIVSGIQGIMKPFDRTAYDNAIAQFQGKPVPHPEAMPKTFDQFGKEDWINFGVGMGIQGINAFLLGRGMGEAPGLTIAREPVTGGEISAKRPYQTAGPVSIEQRLPVVEEPEREVKARDTRDALAEQAKAQEQPPAVEVRSVAPTVMDQLRPAIRLDETTQPIVGEQGQTHTQMIKVQPNPSQFSRDEQRGFVMENDPTTFLDRDQAAAKLGVVAPLHSEDLADLQATGEPKGGEAVEEEKGKLEVPPTVQAVEGEEIGREIREGVRRPDA